MSAFGTVLTHAAWRSKPSWAVIATEDEAFDQAIPIDGRAHQPAHHPGARRNAVFMTQPRVIADMIDRAARHAGQAVK